MTSKSSRKKITIICGQQNKCAPKCKYWRLTNIQMGECKVKMMGNVLMDNSTRTQAAVLALNNKIRFSATWHRIVS